MAAYEKQCQNCPNTVVASKKYCSLECYRAYVRDNRVSQVVGNQRTCTKCRTLKDFSDFGVATKNVGGLYSWCKACVSENNRQRRESNPDRHLVSMYKMNQEQFDAMMESQGNCCAICGNSVLGHDGQLRRAVVDHDHSCCAGSVTCGSCVRGILCHRCNRGLGQFGDDPELLRSAIGYLEQKVRISNVQ